MCSALEILLFSLVSFLPYLVLELLAFRRSLRFSPGRTAVLTSLFSLLLLGGGLWLAPGVTRWQLFLLLHLGSGLFFLLATREQIGKKLFMLLIIANDANLVLALTEHLLHGFFPAVSACAYHWRGSLIMLGTEALLLSPMFVYIRWTCAQSLSGKRRLHAWNYLWIIPLIFYLIWLLLLLFGSSSAPIAQGSGAFVLLTMMLCLGSIFVYIMVNQFIREHRQKEELQEKEYALAMQQTQYAHLQDRIEETRRARHDLRHHLHLVSAYLNDGKLDALRSYLQKYSAAMSEDSRISFCAHYAANALLAYFAAQAQTADIRYDATVDLPAHLPIRDEDLVVVLGNLLENAITACKEESAAPSITIYGRADDSAVFFKIANTCTHSPEKKRSASHQGQGIGLHSVRNIARQYDGIMETSWQKGLFTASIMLIFPDSPEK